MKFLNRHINQKASRVRYAVYIALLTGTVGIGYADSGFAKTNGPIVFSSARNGNNEIYRVNEDGTGLVNLTNTPSIQEVTPVFSADGQKITFVSDRAGRGNQDIYTMNSDGSNTQRVTTNAAADTAPTWSPSGKKIAFESKRSGRTHIYSIDVDGTNEQQLTTAYHNFQPSWSPDGKKIALIGERQWPPQYAGGLSDVFVMDAVQGDKMPMHRVTYYSREDHTPVWSPDGKKLAFISARPVSSYDSLFSLFTTVYTVDAESDDLHGIQNVTPRVVSCAYGQVDDNLIWSPDGRFIGYKRSGSKCPAGTLGHYVVKSDGSSTPVKLSGLLPADSGFSWQPLP